MVHIVGEKEKKIKEAMFLMGMRMEAYWLSWVLTCVHFEHPKHEAPADYRTTRLGATLTR